MHKTIYTVYGTGFQIVPYVAYGTKLVAGQGGQGGQGGHGPGKKSTAKFAYEHSISALSGFPPRLRCGAIPVRYRYHTCIVLYLKLLYL